MGPTCPHLNPHFFRYPTLFLYLLAAVFGIYMLGRMALGATTEDLLVEIAMDPSAFILISRGTSACLGALTVIAVFFVGRHFAGRAVGLVAAFLMSVCYLHVRESHFGLTDVAMTGFIMCAVVFLLRCVNEGLHGRLVAWAGLLTGWAASTKYGGGFLVCAMGIVLVADAMKKNPGLLIRDVRGVCMRVLKTPALYLYGACATVGFLMFTPFSLLDFSTFWRDLTAEAEHLGTGHASLSLGYGFWYHARYTLPDGLGWPVLLGGIAGAGISARKDMTRTLVLAAFPLIFYLVAGKGQTVFVRYMIPVAPFLCVFCAVTVAAIGARLPLKSWALAALSLLFALPSIHRTWHFDQLISREDSRVLAANWIHAHVPEGSAIYQSGTIWAQAQIAPSLNALKAQLAATHAQGRQGRLLQIQMKQTRSDQGYDLFAYDPEHPVYERDFLPDYAILYDSPLSVYTPLPEALETWVARHYDLAQTIDGAGRNGAWYDWIDAFFVPFAGKTTAVRPGPNVRIYARRTPEETAK